MFAEYVAIICVFSPMVFLLFMWLYKHFRWIHIGKIDRTQWSPQDYIDWYVSEMGTLDWDDNTEKALRIGWNYAFYQRFTNRKKP